MAVLEAGGLMLSGCRAGWDEEEGGGVHLGLGGGRQGAAQPGGRHGLPLLRRRRRLVLAVLGWQHAFTCPE
jgi:hypothetical protein